MLELLINPKRAEKKPWQMFLIGFFYASLSLFLSWLLFSKDAVLSKYLGIFVITFCVIFSMPFVYYTIKLEERKDIIYSNEKNLLKEHSRAILTFLWLFLGFIVAFSLWNILVPNGGKYFNAQIETFCQINRPANFNECVQEYGIEEKKYTVGSVIGSERFSSIFSNNIYVLIFTLLLSVAFGAGAIFILAWNASVIAAAISIFIRSDIAKLPIGLARYLIHGLPEVCAYFIAALSGGILGIAVIRHDTKSERFWSIINDSMILVIIAIVILFLATLIEVFITPRLF